ncbi:MAG: transposase family protein [Phascolarctobacterium sp.]
MKNYYIQNIKYLPIIDKPLIVFFRKRRYLCKICNATFTKNNDYIKEYSNFFVYFIYLQ